MMVNTFLPYEEFSECAKVLDDKRLYKQIVECKQILRALRGETKGWLNHPITKMWRGYEDALEHYQMAMFKEWAKRRWDFDVVFSGASTFFPVMPCWLGDEELHFTHRCNLLRKDKEHYRKFFDLRKHRFYDTVDYKWTRGGAK